MSRAGLSLKVFNDDRGCFCLICLGIDGPGISAHFGGPKILPTPWEGVYPAKMLELLTRSLFGHLGKGPGYHVEDASVDIQ